LGIGSKLKVHVAAPAAVAAPAITGAATDLEIGAAQRRPLQAHQHVLGAWYRHRQIAHADDRHESMIFVDKPP
jgi:hypothetical protein